MIPGRVRMGVRGNGNGQGGVFFGRFYSSKWLAFPVLGHKKGPSSKGEICSGTILRQHEGLLQLIVDIRIK